MGFVRKCSRKKARLVRDVMEGRELGVDLHDVNVEWEDTPFVDPRSIPQGLETAAEWGILFDGKTIYIDGYELPSGARVRVERCSG